MNRTRIAPSPTGSLHLGNARTFLANWLLAKQLEWQIVFRIEDLDGPRVRAGGDVAAVEDLHWLGIDWDTTQPHQSTRIAEYQAAAHQLLAGGKAFACTCTRKDIEQAASAPHAEDGASIYPGTCRGKYATLADAQATGKPASIRFIMPDEVVGFTDQFAGRNQWNVANELGDFVILKADGTSAYQLAVVMDDVAAGVTAVVRGDELLTSTPRQILIYRALGLADKIPHYWHLPMIVGEDNRRLAKRHGDIKLSHLRDQGVPTGRVLALLARWLGVEDVGETVDDVWNLVDRFDLNRLSHEPIIFTPADEKWLMQGAR